MKTVLVRAALVVTVTAATALSFAFTDVPRWPQPTAIAGALSKAEQSVCTQASRMLKRGDRAGAEALLRQDLLSRPNAGDAHYSLAEFLFDVKAPGDEARRELLAATRLEPDNHGWREQMVRLLVAAPAGELTLTAFLEECLRATPEDIFLRERLAWAYAESNQRARCRQECLEVLRRGGHLGLRSAFVGLMRSVGCGAEVEAAARARLAKYKPQAESFNELGDWLEAGGRSDDALACFRQALALGDEPGGIHFLHGPDAERNHARSAIARLLLAKDQVAEAAQTLLVKLSRDGIGWTVSDDLLAAMLMARGQRDVVEAALDAAVRNDAGETCKAIRQRVLALQRI